MSDFYCENIFSGKIEITTVKETENILAFYHTKPSWTIHIVIVPKEHIKTFTDANTKILGEIMSVAQDIIKSLKLDKSNYKLIVNGGSFQDSEHLHFHLVSGKRGIDLGE